MMYYLHIVSRGRFICSLSTYKKFDSELQNMFTNKTGINIDYLWEWKNYG
ncbi:protein of unknown function [[Clostridium] ultunense Esp]|uniref:Transposase n=1 Tax=[Clostridium] ultunense Esp TaxID=1288971 RepID=A0A1M4PPG4_9FIRM|nr:protein of unknown function [[Clostridium] ultunense Esp]